jgi:hypothetical protein
MEGVRGIRVLKDSTAMKKLDFLRISCLINAFGKARQGYCKKRC